jgi:hypothetical protein
LFSEAGAQAATSEAKIQELQLLSGDKPDHPGSRKLVRYFGSDFQEPASPATSSLMWLYRKQDQNRGPMNKPLLLIQGDRF